MNSDLKFAIFKITENDCQDWGYVLPTPSFITSRVKIHNETFGDDHDLKIAAHQLHIHALLILTVAIK